MIEEKKPDQEEMDLSEQTTQVETNDAEAKQKQVLIIDILFDFLRTAEELNPVLCGYFCKLINSLFNSHRKEFNLYVLNPQNQVIEYMIKHIYNRSIADTLTKLLNQDIIHSEF